MGFHIHFKELESKRELDNLIMFLLEQDLGYPNYEDWVQRAEHELSSGIKGVVQAFVEAHLVGDLVYQPHKEAPRILELKNLRIHPQLRTRKFAEFMVRQVEAESKGRYDAVILDARANQPGIINFMEACGYTAFATLPLYQDSVPDVAMLKVLNKEKSDSMIVSAKKIVYGKAV